MTKSSSWFSQADRISGTELFDGLTTGRQIILVVGQFVQCITLNKTPELPILSKALLKYASIIV